MCIQGSRPDAKLGAIPERNGVSGTIDIVKLWNSFFTSERLLGGMVEDDSLRVTLETYPIITRVEFLDAERTRALALRVIAERLENREEPAEFLNVPGGVSNWPEYQEIFIEYSRATCSTARKCPTGRRGGCGMRPGGHPATRRTPAPSDP
jgi:hypothetical protein